MTRIFLFALIAISIVACRTEDSDKTEIKEITSEAPCDSLELEMFDDDGNPYLQKVPCGDSETEK